jgi:hypothetical protein
LSIFLIAGWQSGGEGAKLHVDKKVRLEIRG